MLGRATLGNPWLIAQIADLMEGREMRPMPSAADRLRYCIVHYRAMVDELGEARAVPQMRKHVALYLKGIPGAAVLRERIMHIDSAAEGDRALSRRRSHASKTRRWLRRDMPVTIEFVQFLEASATSIDAAHLRALAAYLKLVLVDNGDRSAAALERSIRWPKTHALAYVERYWRLSAEDQVARCCAGRGVAQLEGDDALKVLLVLMDDAKGGWTNRAFRSSHINTRTSTKSRTIGRRWCIWTAEEPTPKLLRMARV